MLTASLISPNDPDGAPDPAHTPTPTPTPTPTETHTAIVPVQRNGQITIAERYLAGDARAYQWRAFDAASETGLFVTEGHRGDEDLTVVGRTGPIATLTCARDLRCPPLDNWLSFAATLGPGADEVTVASGDGAAQVIGYDGSLRRTIDLTATIADGEDVRGLRWSPDGGRLAVTTIHQERGEWRSASRVWLVDREGGNAQLAYSLWQDRQAWVDRQSRKDTPSGFDGTGVIWTASGWGWSPDGQSLLLDIVIGTNRSDVVVLHLLPDGAASPVMAQTLYHSNRHFDWAGNVAWSPDGTRIAVRTSPPGPEYKHRVTEISAEDGSVIAQHGHLNGWLIWQARDG
ncbi:MAG TPA: hypothetical protein VFV76_12785 [Actinomycetes bacterium]|nr:hypothetical protein [Actinomycetes bacterium]